jgi:RimJ/RimL family protein N-acetyltransferase
MDLTPVTLEGRWLRLEPISPAHALGILDALSHEEVYRYLPWWPPKDLEDALEFVEQAEQQMDRGEAVVYAQVWRETGRTIGSTRLLDVRPNDRQVEIGGTFLHPDFWRTVANTESKYLFLRYCFETLGCVRVALKTDGRNERSQRAIERLGAVKEGVLRKHMDCRGYQRDTVYYSVLDDEWPAVKGQLEQGLYDSKATGPG